MYPLLHVATYMTRIDYNALLTPLIAKAYVVQWIERWTLESGADDSNHGVGRYFFLFIAKTEVPRDVRNSKVQKQDKFRRYWSQH